MTNVNDRTSVEKATGDLFGQLFPEYDDEAFAASVELFRHRFEANGFDTSWFNGKECLDAGCGGGRYSIAMALLGAKRVVGVDLSEDNVRDARQRASKLNLTQVHFQVGSLLDLSQVEGDFDFICCSGVLMIVKEPEKGMAELTRLVRPGGLLYLLVYATGGLRWPLIELLRPIADDIGFKVVDRAVSLANLPVNKRRTYLDDLFCPILDFYHWERLQGMLERYGFDQIHRWEKGRLDHEENLKEYRQDVEGLLTLWEAGARANDPLVRPHRERFVVGRQVAQSVIAAISQAEAVVMRGNVSEAEAMRQIIGQGHHRVLSRKREN